MVEKEERGLPKLEQLAAKKERLFKALEELFGELNIVNHENKIMTRNDYPPEDYVDLNPWLRSNRGKELTVAEMNPYELEDLHKFMEKKKKEEKSGQKNNAA